MENVILSPTQKALNINLHQNIYGTFSEIGAGQEVARNFYRVGAASGTIAKSMSAYDKSFSDSIYGKEEDNRYVTQNRLDKMHQIHVKPMKKECDLVLDTENNTNIDLLIDVIKKNMK